MAQRRGVMARLKRFWQGLTGSGVRTYGDDALPGAHDADPAARANAEIQTRNRLRGSNAP